MRAFVRGSRPKQERSAKGFKYACDERSTARAKNCNLWTHCLHAAETNCNFGEQMSRNFACRELCCVATSERRSLRHFSLRTNLFRIGPKNLQLGRKPLPLPSNNYRTLETELLVRRQSWTEWVVFHNVNTVDSTVCATLTVLPRLVGP